MSDTRSVLLRSSLEFRRSFRAPIDRVFAVLADHEGMSRWPGIDRVTLFREGVDRNGLGAIRRVHVLGLTLDEEIVRWEPPNGFDYKITKGLPVEHLGSVQLSERDGETHLLWKIRLESWVPMLATLVLARLRSGLPAAMEHVAREAARDAAR